MYEAEKLVEKICTDGHRETVDRRVRKCSCGAPFVPKPKKPAPRFKVTMELVCTASEVKKLLQNHPDAKFTTNPTN